MGEGGSSLRLGDVDVWADVPLDVLPRSLVQSIETEDWASARRELANVMDGVSTDGVYGRSLLQLVRRLPLGIDPVFDRYRAAAAIDYGDWDDLRRALDAAPLHAEELVALRETLLRSVNEVHGSPTTSPLEAPFLAYEFDLTARFGWYRQWAKRLPKHDAQARFQRPDVPAGRHFRYRNLHHTVLLAVGEAHAGSLFAAAALADEGTRLGDHGEPLQDLASDLHGLVLMAMGDARPSTELRIFQRIRRATGTSPLGTLELLMHVMPFISLASADEFEQAATLAQTISSRLGIPRSQLQAYAWSVASRAVSGTRAERSGLAGVLSASRQADPGLRVLPLLLAARFSRRYAEFQDVERLARRVGNMWAHISSLCWMLALDPSLSVAKNLDRLLLATGWRRPVLVPPEVLAETALGLVALGFMSQRVIELALATGQTTIAAEIAARHAKNAELPEHVRLAGVEALSKIGTAHAQRSLTTLASPSDEVGRAAAALAYRGPRRSGLSEREVEVLELAGRGLTNREIAERLTISQHTVARHLVNARDKLGAANRADAAVRLGRLTAAAEQWPKTAARQGSPVSVPYRATQRS